MSVIMHYVTIQACMERGLYSDPELGEEEKVLEMKSKLDQWVFISTQYKSEFNDKNCCCQNVLLNIVNNYVYAIFSC